MPDEIARVIVEYDSRLNKSKEDFSSFDARVKEAGATLDLFIAKQSRLGGALPAGASEQISAFAGKYDLLTAAAARHYAAVNRYQSEGVAGLNPRQAAGRLGYLAGSAKASGNLLGDIRGEFQPLADMVFTPASQQIRTSLSTIPLAMDSVTRNIETNKSLIKGAFGEIKDASVAAGEELKALGIKQKTAVSVGPDGMVITNRYTSKYGSLSTKLVDEPAQLREANKIAKDEATKFDALGASANRAANLVDRFSRAEFEASLRGKSLEEQLRSTEARLSSLGAVSGMGGTEKVQLQGRAEALRSQIGAQQARDISATASATDRAAVSMKRFSDAEFEASLKGQPLATQLSMIESRMASMGAADPARVNLSGRASGISAQISAQDVKESERLAKSQFEAALAMENKAGKARLLKDHLSTLTSGTEEYNRTLTRLGNLVNQTGSRFGSMATKILESIIIWEGLKYVTTTINSVIDSQREYSLETARFAAITEQNIGGATRQWEALANVAVRAGVSPMKAASTIRIASQMGSGDIAGQEAFVKTTSQLEELTGVASETISRSLSSALRQADKPLSDAAHIGDMIANSLQRIPAAKLEDVVNALEEAPALARLWAVEFEDAFSIIIEGASRAQESPEQVATAFQRLSQGLNEIAQGGEKAWTRQNQLMDDFGLKVKDGEGKLRKIPEILKDVANILPTLSAPRQQEFLNVLAGGTIRPEQLRTIIGGLEAFNVDLSSAIQSMGGTLQGMVDIIDGSLGQTVKVMDARIEQLKERSGIIENLFVSILAGTVGRYGGKQGAELTGGIAGMASGGFMTEGEQMRLNFMKGLYGLSPEEAEKEIEEWNRRVKAAVDKQRQDQGIVGLIGYSQARIQASAALTITKEQQDIVLKELAEANAKTSAISQNIASQQSKESPAQNQARSVRTASPQEQFAERARSIMLNQEGGLTGESVLPTQQLDLTKYSMDEINQAKQLALQLDMMELEALRAQLAALGFSKDQVDGIVSKRKEELDTTILLLRTQQGISYEIGNGADKLQEALQQMDKQKQEMSSSFQFRRLKDVDPSQFGQLEALAQMYNKFLTNIGSPEKSQNINLLLGENNVFKTMNVRMTALQLALEDLTKVEKAQLSGTWNMPAGATALVPISSLDLQRWNSKGGGGLSEEAIRALMGATAESGTGVENAVMRSSQDIVAAIIAGKTTPTEGLKEIVASGQDPRTFALQLAQAIREAAAAGIAGARERLTPEKYRTSNALNSMPDFLEELARANAMTKPQPQQSPTAQQTGAFRDMELYRSLLRDSDLYPGQFKSSVPSYRQMETVNVNVSMLPVKATFNANLSVLMDGRVIARTLAPILYDMLIRTARSTGIKPSKP